MWGKFVQIYPIFRYIKWNNYEKSSFWNTKYRNNRRLFILYTDIWDKYIYGRYSILYKDNFTITYGIYKMDRFGMLTYPNINNNFILKYLKIP